MTAISRADTLEAIRAVHARLHSLLDGLDEARMTQPGVEGDWSIKDILYHLTWWEQAALDDLIAHQSGGAHREFDFSRLDAINAQTYREGQSRSLAQVQAELERTVEELLPLIEALPEDDLNRTFPWTDNGPLGALLAEETYKHYGDHLAHIEAWLSAPR